MWVGKSPPHRYSVTGRDPGTTYVVKIKSCNGSGGKTSCSAWSSDHRVTTTVVEVNAGTRPVATTAVTAECPYTESAATKWGNLEGLDVTPLEQQVMTLCWSPVTGADRYTVSVTHEPTANTPTFRTIRTVAAGSGSKTAILIDLVDLSRVPSPGTRPTPTPPPTPTPIPDGLAKYDALGFKITVTRNSPADSYESDMIIVIDSPITQATTKGQARGDVRVEWDSVASLLGTSYDNGEYDLRYRKSRGDSSRSAATAGYFGTPGTPEPDVSSPHTIDSLTSNSVYGLQLVYRDAGPSNDTNIFAVRHAYAWMSDRAARNGSAVAGVPITSRVSETTFKYKICTSSFALDGRFDGRPGTWVPLITAAFAQWQDAMKDDLLTIERDTDPCTDYHSIASKILDQYLNVLSDPVLNSLSREGKISLIESFLQTSEMQQVAQLNVSGIAEQVNLSKGEDFRSSEIKMYDDVDGVEGYLHSVDVFSELSSSIGHRTDCWYEPRIDLATMKQLKNAAGRLLWDPSDGTLMCYVESRKRVEFLPGFYRTEFASGDIFIRRSKFLSDRLLLPGASAKFNICANAADGDNTAYKSFLHEAGHALGIGGPGADDGGHSFGDMSSVMNFYFDEPDCAPHPADIMALHALYQAR